MSTTSLVLVIGGAAAVVLLMLAALGFAGVTSTGTSSEGPVVRPGDGGPPDDGSYGVVMAPAYREKRGLQLFGWEIMGSKYRVLVMLWPRRDAIPRTPGTSTPRAPAPALRP